MNWLGQGPYRVCKNRLAGQEVFTHTKSLQFYLDRAVHQLRANYGAPTSQWSYPEFEGYHGQFYWANLQTTEQPITIVTPTTNLFLRVLTPPATDQAVSYRDPCVSAPAGSRCCMAFSAIGDKILFGHQFHRGHRD